MKRLLEGLRAGMHVWAPTLTGESTLLHAALAADPERASGVSFTAMQFPGIDGNDYLALHPQARQRSIFMTAAMREGLASGRAQLLGLDYLGVQRLLREMPPFDLAVAHLSAPDAQGYCSPGLASDFLPLVWPRAMLVLWLVGAVRIARWARGERRYLVGALIIASPFVLMFAVIASSGLWSFQNYRYIAPAFPLLAISIGATPA